MSVINNQINKDDTSKTYRNGKSKVKQSSVDDMTVIARPEQTLSHEILEVKHVIMLPARYFFVRTVLLGTTAAVRDVPIHKHRGTQSFV